MRSRTITKEKEMREKQLPSFSRGLKCDITAMFELDRCPRLSSILLTMSHGVDTKWTAQEKGRTEL